MSDAMNYRYTPDEIGQLNAEIDRLRALLVESDRIADGYYRLMSEAGDKNERLRAAHEEIIRIKDDTLGPRGGIKPLEGQEHFDRGCRMAFYRCAEISRQALTHEQDASK